MTDRSKQWREIPAGRLGRVARLAGLGARTGASLLLSQDGAAAARRAAEVLGTLRGLAAKVGQMASYVDGIVPEGQREAYEAALRTLRAAAPTSSPAAIRRVVEEDLGAPIDRLFSSFSDEPVASASIGQVHRASLADGSVVAVKVQHPDVERAIEADLENAGVLRALAATVASPTLDTKRVFDEVKARLREELDYRLEAAQQRYFIGIHAGDDKIAIPRVIDDRTARRVLTSEFVEGSTLEQAATRPESERRAWAETLWRFVFRGNLVGGRFNADPHPGNYLFQEDGRIWFLDFGCVQPIEPEPQASARAMHIAALAGDEAAFEAASRALLATRGGEYEKDAVRYSRKCFRPLFSSPFRVERPYVASLLSDVQQMKRHMLGRGSGFVQLPPGMIFMNRLQFGFYSVLARLDAEVDYRATEASFLRAAGLLEASPAATM